MTPPETSMVERATEYLALRRGLGFALRVSGWLLLDFARYADETGHRGSITLDLATRWAMRTHGGATYASQRLSVVRQFARHRLAFDPSTEVPPVGLLGGFPRRRKPPHIYSDGEIADLLRVAAALRPPGGLRPQTYVTLFSLLAATGLRISEARRLTVHDVDLEAGLLVIRESKFRKSRLVPLHPTAVTGLRRYADLRDRYAGLPRSEHFFRTEHAVELKQRAVESSFERLRVRLGWTAQGRARRPRIHDLRHTYASLYLMSGGSLVALAKQLGHTTTRMVEKHYGHLADSWRAEEARKHAPSLGLEEGKVVRLRSRR